MGKIYLLDCTLRDGGYVNDWEFGADTIKGFAKKIAQTGVDIFEVGFLKGDHNDPDTTLYPDIESIIPYITPKSEAMKYVAMVDMSDPIPADRLTPYDGRSVDGIRVIFKKDKIDQAYEYCKRIKELGYFFTANIVTSDRYSDEEFIAVVQRFSEIDPFAVSIVDTFGLIKRDRLKQLVYLTDNNLSEGVALAYHAHNNLQQAFGNAEDVVEMGLQRDLVIDACVFGMGKGAGNLNLELFAQFMNENFDTHYRIEPMLEIMDEYLNDIYKTRFWGYSVPMFLSATTATHTNYSIYYAKKNTLTVKSFNELLRSISEEDKAAYSQERAERYYREYMENYVDDKDAISRLSSELEGRDVLILAPGRSLYSEREAVRSTIGSNTIVIATNFTADEFSPDYVFSGNMRRFSKMQGNTDAKCIITSNVKEATQRDYVVNFASYASEYPEIIDNSALMLLRVLSAADVEEVRIAGMDGYVDSDAPVYYSINLYHDFSSEAEIRNKLISRELQNIKRHMTIHHITPTIYEQ